MIKEDILLIVFQLLCCVFLFILAGIAEKFMNSKWRLFYILPGIVCLSMMAYAGFEKSLIGVYIGSALLLVGLFRPKKLPRRIVSAVSAFLAVSGLVTSNVNPSYRSADYLADFKKGFSAMKERYILAEHKGIDWNALYDKYEPMFAEAAEFHDTEQNFLAWTKFCAEFHDAHTSFYPEDYSLAEQVIRNHSGKDYGLVLLSYTDGRTVAVNVDESLNELGIHNGTVVTSWNGMSSEDANKLSECYELNTFPDNDNAYFYRTMWAAGTGGMGKAEVTFIDDNGTEQTVSLSSIGKYSDRLEDALDTLNQGVQAANVSWNEVNDTTACLRIKMMMFDGQSARDDDYTGMKDELRKKVLELKQQGIEDIVIDIRSNGGGSGTLIMSIAELFVPEGEHYYCNDGVWDSQRHCYKKSDDGKFLLGEKHTFMGENLLGDGHIVLLVNSASVSAADHMTKVMNDMENVTVMGFTEPCGSAQGVSSIELESGMISISASLMLDSDGSIFIDSGEDGQSGNTLDIQVPFDETAVKSLYDDNEDYLMKKAEEFLANK